MTWPRRRYVVTVSGFERSRHWTKRRAEMKASRLLSAGTTITLTGYGKGWDGKR